MTLDWQFAAIALIGFAIGFVTGYGVRAFISYRRRKAARQRRMF
jgi:NhaP-type Na+/H+ or K+/H+ antiporter